MLSSYSLDIYYHNKYLLCRNHGNTIVNKYLVKNKKQKKSTSVDFRQNDNRGKIIMDFCDVYVSSRCNNKMMRMKGDACYCCGNYLDKPRSEEY